MKSSASSIVKNKTQKPQYSKPSTSRSNPPHGSKSPSHMQNHRNPKLSSRESPARNAEFASISINNHQSRGKCKDNNNEITSLEHSATCGCHECFINACLQLPRNDMAAYRSCITTFIESRPCPLEHPHNRKEMCSEHLKLEKESIMTSLNNFISTILDPSGDNLAQCISNDEAPNIPPTYSSFTRIQESAKSAVSMQNLKYLIS